MLGNNCGEKQRKFALLGTNWRSRPALPDRVGGRVTPAVLPQHRTYGSRIRRFLSASNLVSFQHLSLFRASCRLAAIGHLNHLLNLRFVQYSCRPSVARGLYPVRSEITRDYPLVTGSALHYSGFEQLLWRLLTPITPSQHLSMSVARGRMMGLPR